MRRDLPSGTVTFLFTDVEGSTKLLHQLGAERYGDALLEHRRVMRDAFARHGGVEVDTQGDAFFVAFPTADGAMEAAREIATELTEGPIRVRMGLHTGTPHISAEGYVGEDVHLGARMASAGHGGQVLVSARTRELVSNRDFAELGEHRLKDFDEPISIFQLGDERFPPLKTISNTNLPRPASSFVGRDAEIREVVSLVENGARLVALTGPGGSGKTRLAIESAAELVPGFKAGVFWTELAPLRDPALVIDAIAQTIGAKDGVADHVGEREMLLVIDNLEQVIDAAPDLGALVERCRNLVMLVTSRELLRVRGEVEYPVLPLADPHAVELFCARARVEPNESVRQLCRALDNLPLAIELAAARTSVLTPERILERLSGRLDALKGGRDADPRQHTLRATIEWSHELLGEDERRLFARLALFAGGCTLGFAEDVMDADVDTLQSLVEKSLVRRTKDRFWMLETIREYATERLDERDEADEMGRRHAERFLALVEEAEPYLRGESLEWLDRLDVEHDNIRAAFDRFEATGEKELALRLAAATWWLWSLKGHIPEGRRRLERALAGDTRPTAARAAALTGASDLAGDDDDDAMSRRRAEEALELHREQGDDWGTAYCLLLLGLSYSSGGDFTTARKLFEESVRLFDELGDEHWTLQAITRLAWSCEGIGDHEGARALHEESVRRSRASGEAFTEARSMSVLAQFALESGDVDESVVSMLVEAHRIHHARSTHPDRFWDAILLCRFARALALTGAGGFAARLLACFEAVFEEIGMTVGSWIQDLNEQTIAMIREGLDDEAFAEERSRGSKLTPDAAVELALGELERSGHARLRVARP
jgi:predicted ATPase